MHLFVGLFVRSVRETFVRSIRLFVAKESISGASRYVGDSPQPRLSRSTSQARLVKTVKVSCLVELDNSVGSSITWDQTVGIVI